MGGSEGMSAKEKRFAMAAKFEATQRSMSTTVDHVALARRAPVPFDSTWTGESISMTGPIPTDNHLIPSNMVIHKAAASIFKSGDSGAKPLHLSGKPWATYSKPEPSVFDPSASDATSAAAPPPPKPASAIEEEMWRTQYQEWTLQKNAFNPDIAAAMRTNVRKQAALSMVDPAMAQDPARTSENVKAALSHSDTTGPANAAPKVKVKLDPHNYLPTAKIQ